jgi:cytochrome c553
MKGLLLSTALVVALLGVAVSAAPPVRQTRPGGPALAASHDPAPLSPTAQDKIINEYCLGCHDDDGRAGGMSLSDFNPAHADRQPELAEKMIRKLRAGMMPPPVAKERPDAATTKAFAEGLEATLDRSAAAAPNPGWRPFQRLNRAEYARAVKDLLGLDVDVDAFLPADTNSHGYDNVADVQTFSATLLEGYLRAASRVALLAVGDPDSPAAEATYRVAPTESQVGHVDGAPYGTRGGLSVEHTFPADGDYLFKLDLQANPCGLLYGATSAGEQIDLSIDGTRVALLSIDDKMTEAGTGLQMQAGPIHIRAGTHRVSAAFIRKFEGPVIDLIAPIDRTLADTQIGVAYGITTLPHLKDLSIAGPRHVTGVSDTLSRRRIFTCRPTAPGDERSCARSIVERLAGRAFRGPVSEHDMVGLMKFYDAGRREGDFEAGVTAALEAILASPQFLFRVEPLPATARPGGTYRIGDPELASRLSYFLWDDGPDAELIRLAQQGTLHTPAVLERQVHRMLKDPRAVTLSTRFAAQWLRLQDLDQIVPDALLYPYYDRTLADGLKQETELFFNSIVREDRSVLDLLTSDQTFVDERVARHYGMPNVTGSAFQRVTVPDERRGLLGKGAILVLTSVADRTSPVMRGKWVMEVLLGSPPPPPPPNVPALDDSVKAAQGGKMLSTRERMEEHRKNPACASCHRVIDPIGLALENFDATGRWRIKDNEVPVDSAGVMYDGTKVNGPAGLRAALLSHKEIVLRTFTENLMTYALGRRIEYYDQPTIRAIVRSAAADGYRMSAFVLGIVNSPAFQMAKAPAVETTAAEGR